ncbi:Zinc finger, CCHC-type [Sesbania bispinosa]|nr:Zinc finger, CCHC-type [Sesbania bispinosa]
MPSILYLREGGSGDSDRDGGGGDDNDNCSGSRDGDVSGDNDDNDGVGYRATIVVCQKPFKMVSQRQRLARKRYKAEHPELFPKPEPTPPKDPDSKKNKKKKRNALFNRKKADSKDQRIKSNFRKHPLRVPGMKPGESCFICKSKEHIAKLCPQKAEWEKNKICLRCRRRGHRAQNCPEVHVGSKDVKYCYNCGETGHSLSNCPQPLQEGGTKFAECFVCKQRGHLSKNCPQNAHGIYPKGGCCKICGGVTHLAKDCPDKGKKGSAAAHGPLGGSMRTEVRPSGQVTKFVSGDDMEDDFMTDDIYSGDKNDKNKSSKSKDGHVKPKKGPKVVNFN